MNSDFIGKLLTILSLLLLGSVGYASWKENDMKDTFDKDCYESGGIPLRSTYHYDPKENKIHYVCLKQTSVMNLKEW